jgi:cyclopropane-fatty-acyl-phospholipid synthase
MIYKFKSQADADVLMLEANGDQILRMIGRQPSAKGVITAEQMPAAIAALQGAITAFEAAESGATEHAFAAQAVGGDSVRLRARTAPFIDLLQNSAIAGKEVFWGV